MLGGGNIGGGMPKGKAGLLALPLLALAPLLMGAGNKNNNNSPTAEFRREQDVRRTRKNIISSGDTDRFGMQLDRFERILDKQLPNAEKINRAEFVIQTGLGRYHSLKYIRNIIGITRSRRGKCWPIQRIIVNA